MIPQQVIILVFIPVKLVNYFLSKSILLFFRIIEIFRTILDAALTQKNLKHLLNVIKMIVKLIFKLEINAQDADLKSALQLVAIISLLFILL